MTYISYLMKSLLIVLLIFFLTPSVYAKSRLHQILERGELRVGTTGDWNPMTVRDPKTNAYMGFDIDVVTELAKDLGVTLKFVPAEWKTLVNGIVADKYDITTSASITPSRIRAVGYTKSYYQVGTVPITSRKNLMRFSSWEDIDQSGVTVAVTMGTSFEQQVKQFFPKADIKAVEAPARDFQEVLSGRAMVSITSNLEAAKLMQTYPSLAVVPVKTPRSPADLAFMVAQQDQVWLNFLNHWITIKQNRDFFLGLQNKWMPIK